MNNIEAQTRDDNAADPDLQKNDISIGDLSNSRTHRPYKRPLGADSCDYREYFITAADKLVFTLTTRFERVMNVPILIKHTEYGWFRSR